MSNNKISNFLAANSKKNKKDWHKVIADAERDKKWINYSNAIAMRISAAIEDNKDLSQVSIADKLGVKPQQINKILKGAQNLTLKTIADISEAIGKELIEFPPYKDTYITIGEVHAANRFKSYFNSLPNHDTQEKIAFLGYTAEYTFTNSPIMVK